MNSIFSDVWLDFKDCNAWDAISFFRNFRGGVRLPLFIVMCWLIWWDRNKWITSRCVSNAAALAVKAASVLNNYVGSQGQALNPLEAVCRSWCKPREGWLRFNTDGAVRCDSADRGMGLVCRNFNGEVLVAKA